MAELTNAQKTHLTAEVRDAILLSRANPAGVLTHRFEAKGSGSGLYVVRLANVEVMTSEQAYLAWYCTCPAWKNQHEPATARSCKHTQWLGHALAKAMPELSGVYYSHDVPYDVVEMPNAQIRQLADSFERPDNVERVEAAERQVTLALHTIGLNDDRWELLR